MYFTMKKSKKLFLFSLATVAAYFLVTVVLQIDSTTIFPAKKHLQDTGLREINATTKHNLLTLEPTYDVNRTGKHIDSSAISPTKKHLQDTGLREINATTKHDPLIVEPAYHVNRTGKHCEISFEWFEMCPKLYTELGGKCDLINDTFQCPDIRNYSTFRIRQVQLVLTRMLRIFDLLAQKHGIKYWIADGTLLGAARHQGFIPWDFHGINIQIPYKEYWKFFQVASELPDDIFFQNTKSDPYFCFEYDIPRMCENEHAPRLRDRNSCKKYCIAHGCKYHDGLMIDIFVRSTVDSSVYPLKRMKFEGFTFPVQNDWKNLRSVFGRSDWFKIFTDHVKQPQEYPDVFNGCEKLTQG